jgi:hypothetical protein
MSKDQELETINGKPLHPGVEQLCTEFEAGKLGRRSTVIETAA